MQIDGIPKKLVELTALSVKDNKIRRIFILADGKRSLGQIYQLCKIDEEQGVSLTKVLLDGGYISIASDEISIPAKTAKPGQQLVSTADFVESLSAELAIYVGPVAAMLVKKIALPEQGVTSEDIDKVINILAKEIENEEDKQRFLKNMESTYT